jgi:hypothetical protein
MCNLASKINSHLAGSKNIIADFLSRWHLSNEFKDKFYTSVVYKM